MLGKKRQILANNGENSDVVLLAEVLRGSGEGRSAGGVAKLLDDAVEAEELAVWLLRLEDAVGDEREGIAGVDLKIEDGEFDVRDGA